MQIKYFLSRILLLLVLLCTISWGSAAIITLEMPVGARQLGMGEIGVAMSDDAYATYYNPAGLAFGPMADEWELSKKKKEKALQFTTLSSRNRTGFFAQPEVWAGSSEGMHYFDGREWKDYHTEVLEGNKRVRDVLKRYMGREDNLDSLVKFVRELNGAKTFDEEEMLVEVKIPWNLMIKDTVTSILFEARTNKLWVGTVSGLYRFDGHGWKSYELELGKKRVSSIVAEGTIIWVGTNDGLFVYKKGEFTKKGSVLPSQDITTLSWSPIRKELYVGVRGHGIAKLVPKSTSKEANDKWSMFTLDDGILDVNPREILVDSAGHVWAAHKGGLSHFNLRRWDQIKFDKNEVHSLATDKDGAIWIGTSKGVWKHVPDYTTAKGRKVENQRKETINDESTGTWTHFHTGNGLKNNRVVSIESQGDDVWFATGAGIERFNMASMQVSLFYEKLLPVLNIPDLYHLFTGMTFPMGDWGTIGGFVNFVSFGETIVSSDDNVSDGANLNSSEIVAALSYGTKLTSKLGVGLNFKFFYSNLSSGGAVGAEEAKTASYAVDIGVQRKDILPGLDLGLALANIGPNVYYVDKSQEDPIPLTWRMGFMWHALNKVDHKINIASDYSKEAIYYNDDGDAEPFYISSWKSWAYPQNSEDPAFGHALREGIIGIGVEYIYSNIFAGRLGYMHDSDGERQEMDWGVGILLSDILQLDLAGVKEVGSKSDGVRDGQLRFSLGFKF